MQWQADAYVNDFLDGTLKAVTAQRSLLIKSTFQFQRGIQMSKLFAAVFAATFALGSFSAFAADDTKKDTMTKDAPKVDCKDEKNKDHKDCKPVKK